MNLSTDSFPRKTIGSAIILALGLAAAPAVADVQIGSAAQVVNSVTGTLASTRQEQVLRAGIDVFQNEAIDTANASASRVVFQDQTQLSIGPASRVVLDRFVFDPNPAASVVAVSIAKGVARFSTGLLPKPDYEVTTPACTIGVRGTVFTTIVSESRDSWVSVEEGATAVSAQGVTVTVNAGQTTFVAFGRPPTPPSPSTAPPAITTQMDALLLTTAPPRNPPPPSGTYPYGTPDSGYPPYGYQPGEYRPPSGGSQPGVGGGVGVGGGLGVGGGDLGGSRGYPVGVSNGGNSTSSGFSGGNSTFGGRSH
jgi:hypothetical protein